MTGCDLSVVIPCHNVGTLLSEAIDSVLDQKSSVEELEVIVVDDHTSDGETLEELRKWAHGDSRVRILSNEGVRGPAAARNVGIRASRGRWVGFLDSDDVWLAGGLQARWRVVETEPSAEWVGGDLRIWRSGCEPDTTSFFQHAEWSSVVLADAYATGRAIRLRRPVAEFVRTPLTWTGAALVTRNLLARLDGFETRLRKAEDLHLWIRAAREADFFFVPQAVALYRQRPQSLMHEAEPPEDWTIRAYTMLLQDDRYAPYRRELHRKLAFAHSQNAVYHRRDGNRRRAVSAALRSVLHTPAVATAWRNLAGALLRCW